MAKTMKTAITIPNEDYALIEKMRKETGKSRSEILIDAFHETMKARKVKEMEAQYAEGYRRMPETKEELAEVDAMLKSAAEDIAKDYPW